MTDHHSERQLGDIQSFFHINVNCTDLDRSLAFYNLLGFELVADFAAMGDPDFGTIGLAPVLRLPADVDGRAVLLMPKGRRDGTRLDLIEWRSPKVVGDARANLAQPGVGRICLRTLDAVALHKRLVEAGYQPYSEALPIRMGGSELMVFCVEDPDGVVIELMEFVRPAG
ncbi:VOC family protein [Tianweitania sediminis]|uniref:VOC family protein n=1 Tax=Tianweitania sediminis TaxID=1502156 RepID=A0A8J7RQI2_9HYPH|nr:VOC family protein [Tianweitania sediminis]